MDQRFFLGFLEVYHLSISKLTLVRYRSIVHYDHLLLVQRPRTGTSRRYLVCHLRWLKHVVPDDQLRYGDHLRRSRSLQEPLHLLTIVWGVLVLFVMADSPLNAKFFNACQRYVAIGSGRTMPVSRTIILNEVKFKRQLWILKCIF